jgi:hypothetical protein
LVALLSFVLGFRRIRRIFWRNKNWWRRSPPFWLWWWTFWLWRRWSFWWRRWRSFWFWRRTLNYLKNPYNSNIRWIK